MFLVHKLLDFWVPDPPAPFQDNSQRPSSRPAPGPLDRSPQIGAHVGGVNASHDDTMPLTKKYGWHGLLVEPNPFLFKELHRKYRDWPNLYFAQLGIGATDGNMTFYAVSDELDPETGKSLTGGRDRQWFVTQLSTFDEAIARKRMRSVKMIPMPVEVNTFPTLIAKPSHTIKMPHYILIDTEVLDALPPRDASEGKRRQRRPPEAVRQAVGGGCQSGWVRLLSVTNAVEAGTWRQGDSGWA